MAIPLTELLKQVPPEVELRVRKARDRWRGVLQDAIRAECRLAMRSEIEEPGSVPQVRVDVSAGMPQVLRQAAFPDDLQYVLLLARYRRALAEATASKGGLLELHKRLLALPLGRDWANIDPEPIEWVGDWAQRLLHRLDAHDPVGRVLSVNEDVLGAYIYRADVNDEYRANTARIELYWGVIGLIAEWMGCEVEDLTIVVLAHELGHAYTQLGADIEGRRWPSADFSRAETALKEGLAQYYTYRALQRTQLRLPAALSVFESLLRKQPAPYHAHEQWIEGVSPEAVRQAMLEVRRWREGKHDQFSKRLVRIGANLHRPSDPPF